MKKIAFFFAATVIAMTACGNKAATNTGSDESAAKKSLREKLEWLAPTAPANENNEIEKVYVTYRTPNGKETTLVGTLPWAVDASEFDGGAIDTDTDINGDGYPDLVVFLGTLMTSINGRMYDAFLWNEKQGAFEHVEGYNDIGNATPQPEKQRVMSYIPARDGSINYTEYKWKGNQLEQTRSWNAATDTEGVVADAPTGMAPNDQWTEEAVEKQLKAIYAEVSRAFAPSADGLEANIDLDAMFCTQYWNETLQEVVPSTLASDPMTANLRMSRFAGLTAWMRLSSPSTSRWNCSQATRQQPLSTSSRASSGCTPCWDLNGRTVSGASMTGKKWATTAKACWER